MKFCDTNHYIRRLHGYDFEDDVIGCIGIEFFGSKHCEIKHIAVSINHRGEGIGSKMISFIKDKYSLSFISAETDKNTVNFYKNYGFKIISLGEKYPGGERFHCILINRLVLLQHYGAIVEEDRQ